MKINQRTAEPHQPVFDNVKVHDIVTKKGARGQVRVGSVDAAGHQAAENLLRSLGLFDRRGY